MKFKKYIKEKRSSVTAAFWISPDGKTIGSVESHIQQVLMNSRKFGLDLQDIRDLYSKYNEPVGHEGMAREEIIEGLVMDGWIRIRKYPNSHYSINVVNYHKVDIGLLIEWADKMLSSGVAGFRENDEDFPVVINPLVGKVWKITIGKLRDYAEVPQKKLRVLDSYEYFNDRKVMDLNEKIEEVKKYKIDEASRFVKVMKYLLGQKNAGKGVAIFTGQNPGKPLPPKENKKIYNQLKQELKTKGYTFFQQIGMYGGFEKSLVVINMSEREAKQFSDKYKQESFIWGKEGKFCMILGGKRAQCTDISTGKGIDNLEDFYSQVQGRKYAMDFDFPEGFFD